jgi:hypothetical protein
VTPCGWRWQGGGARIAQKLKETGMASSSLVENGKSGFGKTKDKSDIRTPYHALEKIRISIRNPAGNNALHKNSDRF